MNDFAMPRATLAAPTRRERQADLLRALRGVVAERENLRRQEAELVARARDLNTSWADIGEALGLTPKGAKVAADRRAAR